MTNFQSGVAFFVPRTLEPQKDSFFLAVPATMQEEDGYNLKNTSPPCTPRKADVKNTSPPCTPRRADGFALTQPTTPTKVAYCPFATSMPVAPKLPSLLKALSIGSVDQVRDALLAEPDEAVSPFFDGGFEPPLCFALRRQCCAEIIQLLLEHGADTEIKDRRNQAPADILKSFRNDRAFNRYEDIDVIELMLGLDPMDLPEDVHRTFVPNWCVLKQSQRVQLPDDALQLLDSIF